jgi:allantoate deiminase
MKDRALRAIEECKLLATMTEEPGRITRRFLTAPTHPVHAHLRARMEAIGLTVRVDAAGNLRGLWQAQGASGKRLLIGSHIDTVPDAGAFDGVLGVTMALELAALAQERGLALSIEVIAFSEEEGVRFGVPFLGSRAVAGRFDSEIFGLADRDGTTVEAAIRAFGLHPENIDEAVAGDEAIAFFEMHIEQGPVLENDELPVAAVTGIVGQTRLTLEFIGQANHAGTTPMALRHDALAAAAEWIGAVETCARRSEGLAATVGKIAVKPNAVNVVAGSAELSLDVRHMLDASRIAATEELIAAAGAIADRRGLTLVWRKLTETPAVPMDERLTAFVCDAIEAAGKPVKRMSSGAGHDAMVMAARMPTAMLFLRSPGGISHHPAESVLADDVETGLRVAWNFLERLAADVR